MTQRIFLATTLALVLAVPAVATTFVVPNDRDLIHRAGAIVIGTALPSYSRMTPVGGLETVTPIDVEEVIAGSVASDVLDVVEPGGRIGDRASIIAGVPRFTPGNRLLLLLSRTGDDRWSVTELVLGKFTFHQEGAEPVLRRDAAEIVGWDPNGAVHRERPRSASRFLEFIRDEVRGRMSPATYFEGPAAGWIATTEAMQDSVSTSMFLPAANAVYSATSYTMTLSGTQGGRWNVFPSPVTFYMGTVQEPGAPGGGATAIQTAFASWNNDAGSNVNYVFGGTDNGTHMQGLHAPDGANTILFERNLGTWGVGPFSCSGSTYSGTLGLGGITNASGTHTFNGETFWNTLEADVEMNQGIANCTTLFNNGDWNSAVTHEVGHTLSFRHADQNRASNGACTPDLECSSSAIMTAVVTRNLNGTLQPWDVNAVRAVYAGAGGGTPPPPTISSIAPTSGAASPTVVLTITGANFVAGSTVYIGGRLATSVQFVSSSQITAVTPTLPGGSLNDVTVVTPAGTATLSNAFFADFYDVTQAHPFHGSIEKIFRAGITGGCGGGNYCPDAPVRRDQMAIFLERGEHGGSYVPPPATGTMFADVPASAFAAAFIEQLAREGITAGCATGLYCPANSVLRSQMAIFILRAKHGGAYTPPAATGTMFADVPANSFAAAWIEQVAREGISGGCDATHFCPTAVITRGAMAVWMANAFGL